MAGIAVFRSDEARAAYCHLIEKPWPTAPCVTRVDTRFIWSTMCWNAGDPSEKPPALAMHGDHAAGRLSWCAADPRRRPTVTWERSAMSKS